MVSTEVLWWEGARPAAPVTEPPARADVTIVGGGYTGLWTAHHLLRHEPTLEVVVLEAEQVGFGASGRNGGWVSALWPVAPERIEAGHGRAAAAAMLGALRHTVDEVGAFCSAYDVDAGFVKGGTLAVARGAAQASRARSQAAHGAAWGDGTVWLDPGAVRERLATDSDGGTWSPHCARVQPRSLVDGLARVVREQGGVVTEGARVARVEPGRVTLAGGRTVRSRYVVRATEAWTATLAPWRRRVVPVHSLMVATEPLTPAQWASVGLEARETFSDHGHVVIYGQQTTDGRIAFGGRGAPYWWRSRIRTSFLGSSGTRPGSTDPAVRVFGALRQTLLDLLPQLEGVAFTHAWGGALGIARDWHPSVGLDPGSGIAWAGGYVGDGVAAAHLAGATLADLVLRRDSERVRLPWVGHQSPDWEPEPLRWLGVNAGLRLAGLADAEEARTGRPARSVRLLGRLTGG